MTSFLSFHDFYSYMQTLAVIIFNKMNIKLYMISEMTSITKLCIIKSESIPINNNVFDLRHNRNTM